MKRVDAPSVIPARSPWFAITMGICGLLVGYVLVMGPHAVSAENLARCPCADGQCGAHDGQS